MATVTLSSLKTQVRQRADMVSSQFISDSELLSFINTSIAELYDLLVQKFGNDYFLLSTSFNLVPNTDIYALPVTFYKLIGVDLQLQNGEYSTLKRFEFSERNQYTTALYRGVFGAAYLRYKIQGNDIRFVPMPTSGDQIRIWYAPLPTYLVNDSDTFDGYSGWEEYVIVDAAIKCLEKEESNTAALMNRKAYLIKRIEEAAGNRDAAFSPRIADTRRIEFEQGTEFRFY